MNAAPLAPVLVFTATVEQPNVGPVTTTTVTIDGVEYQIETAGNGETEVWLGSSEDASAFLGYYHTICVTDKTLSAKIHPAVVKHHRVRRRHTMNLP